MQQNTSNKSMSVQEQMPINNDSKQCKSQSCPNLQLNDKKGKVPLIPKIKVCRNSQQDKDCSQRLTPLPQTNSRKPSQLTPKSQTHQIQCLKLGKCAFESNAKSFLKQQESQKATNKQLAQTYYEQFLHLKKQNQVLDRQLSFIRHERDLLYKKYNQIKDQQRYSYNQRPKRQRRIADDIQRNCICPVIRCNKVYGSQGSLLQHIKIKHAQFYKGPQYEEFLGKRKDQSSEKMNV